MSEVSTQRVLDSIKDIPEDKLDDVADFIESLKWQEHHHEAPDDEFLELTEVPTFHLGKISDHQTTRESIYDDYLSDRC